MSGPAAEKYVLIDDFLIDCSLRETHTFDSEVTDYPVESGSSITDNIRPRPITVEIEALVTNTPIGLMVENRIFEGDSDKQPVIKIYDRLQRIRDNRKPVTISTSLRTYDNMAMKGLTIPRGEHQDAMTFTVSFQQIQTVENVRSIRVSTPIATGGGGGGKGKNKEKSVTLASNPLDMRQVIINKTLGVWWDPDNSAWTAHCSYEEGEHVRDELGFSTVTNISKWHLHRGPVLEVNLPAPLGVGQSKAKDDPFDTTRHTPPHPIRDQIIVTLNQCVLHNFQIRKSTQPENPNIYIPPPRTSLPRTS